MAEQTVGVWTKFSDLIANVESLQKRVQRIRDSDPQLGARWKEGMMRHYGDLLKEALVRAREYAEEAGIPIPDAILNGP